MKKIYFKTSKHACATNADGEMVMNIWRFRPLADDTMRAGYMILVRLVAGQL